MYQKQNVFASIILLPPNFVPFSGIFRTFGIALHHALPKIRNVAPFVTPRFYYDGSSLCRLIYLYSDPRLLSTVPSISELVMYANALFGHL